MTNEMDTQLAKFSQILRILKTRSNKLRSRNFQEQKYIKH